MKLLTSVILSLALLASAGMASAARLKIGTVDFEVLTPALKQLQAKELKSSPTADFKANQTKMKDAVKALQALRKELKAGKDTLSATRKEALQTQIKTQSKALTKQRTDFRTQMMNQRKNSQKVLLDKFKSIIAKIAKRKGIDVVMVDNGVLYATYQVDLTQPVLAEVNKVLKK